MDVGIAPMSVAITRLGGFSTHHLRVLLKNDIHVNDRSLGLEPMCVNSPDELQKVGHVLIFLSQHTKDLSKIKLLNEAEYDEDVIQDPVARYGP